MVAARPLFESSWRRELVREYLADDFNEIADVAFLAGYDNATSFYRAFRAWEGKTPAEWRAAHDKAVNEINTRQQQDRRA